MKSGVTIEIPSDGLDTIGHHFKNTAKDLFVYGIMGALSQLTGLLLLPLWTRVLTISEYGTVDIIVTFVALISTCINLALPSGLIRYFTKYHNQHDRIRFVSTLFIAVVCFGLLTVGALSFLSGFFAEKLFGNQEYDKLLQIGCWTAFLVAARSIPQKVLRMERRIVAFNLVNILSTVLHAVLAVYLVCVVKKGILGILVSQMIASAISLLLSMVLTRGYFRLCFSIRHLKHTLKYSLPLLPAFIILWINRQVDRLLLLMLLGLGGVAIYGATAKIATIVIFLQIIFKQAWSPYAMRIIHDDSRDEFYWLAFKYFTGFFAGISLICIAISPEIFSIILPDEYSKGYMVVPWLIGAAILHHTGAFTKLGMLVSEKTLGISVASFISAALNLIISWILIKLYGFSGAAIGTFIAEFVFTSLLWWFSAKTMALLFDIRLIVTVFLSYVICSILLLVIPATIQNTTYSLMARAVCTIIAIIIIAYHTIDEYVLCRMGVLSKRIARALSFAR